MPRARPKTDAPDELNYDDRVAITRWLKEKYPRLLMKPHLISEMWETCADWHRARGERRSDWAASFREWIRRSAKGRVGEPPAWWAEGRVEQEPETRPSRELESLADVLPLFKEGKG